MTGQRIGYIRVSTFDQNPERQLEGVKVDRAFSDKASGKDVKRPQLEALISFARTGDTVVVHSMDRLARNLDDLRRIVQTLTQRGVHIEFGGTSENGIYGHSRFCNTDFDDKLACLNLSG
uniref:recombinase family protein n=1 Tax=Escherichia coli TaxID=562 RepID=UPI00201A342C